MKSKAVFALLTVMCSSSLFASSYALTLDTTNFNLAGAPPRPFYLDFIVTTGGTPLLNTITISGLNTNGVTGLSASQGGGSYDSVGGVATISTSAPLLNEVILAWTPLTALSLFIDLGNAPQDNIPQNDLFQFNIIYTTLGCDPALNCPLIETTDSFASNLMMFEITAGGVANLASYDSGVFGGSGPTVTFTAPGLSAVPEPASAGMIALGCVGLALIRRKQR